MTRNTRGTAQSAGSRQKLRRRFLQSLRHGCDIQRNVARRAACVTSPGRGDGSPVARCLLDTHLGTARAGSAGTPQAQLARRPSAPTTETNGLAQGSRPPWRHRCSSLHRRPARGSWPTRRNRCSGCGQARAGQTSHTFTPTTSSPDRLGDLR